MDAVPAELGTYLFGYSFTMYTQMLLACCKVGQRQEYLAVAYHTDVQYTQRGNHVGMYAEVLVKGK